MTALSDFAAGQRPLFPGMSLAAALWPTRAVDTPTERLATGVRLTALVAIGCIALWISAKIKVDFYPIPMTMQTFVVLAIGAAYGPRLAAATILAYLAQGAFGLPVFTETPARGIGLAYMVGPTGGYLVGFLAGAVVTGILAANGFGRSIWKLGVAMLAGHAMIFAFGFAWLALRIGAQSAFIHGVEPFYAATLFKTALAAAAIRAGWVLADHRRR